LSKFNFVRQTTGDVCRVSARPPPIFVEAKTGMLIGVKVYSISLRLKILSFEDPPKITDCQQKLSLWLWNRWLNWLQSLSGPQFGSKLPANFTWLAGHIQVVRHAFNRGRCRIWRLSDDSGEWQIWFSVMRVLRDSWTEV